MKVRRNRLVHIHRCRGITRKTIWLFLRYDPSLRKIYSLSTPQLSHLFSLSSKNAEVFYEDLHSQITFHQLKQDLKYYSILTIVDENYPYVLKQIKDPPIVLYAKGDVSLLHHTPSLSIIGTRNPSTEAKFKTESIIRPLVAHKFMIISGMARGIDSYAHHKTLKYHGKTIAVLGAGFHHIYPKQNKMLFEKIAEKGLLLSEYPPNVPPSRFHFPERNRIISGLSFGTLVIEAMERSGTLITVEQALDQGREVYAMPGSIFLPQTKGCHQMIRDGAKLILEAKDILEDWDEIGKNLYYSKESSKS